MCSIVFPVHANICQDHLGLKVRGTEILMFINDRSTELLMQKVLQRVDERLTVKCMNAERFLEETKRKREKQNTVLVQCITCP